MGPKIPTHNLKFAFKYKLLWNAWSNTEKCPFPPCLLKGQFALAFPVAVPCAAEGWELWGGSRGQAENVAELEVKVNCLCFIFYILVLICGHE